MPIFLQQVVGGLVRTVIAGALGWLVINGYITEGDAATFVAASTSFILVILWSAWEKYQTRRGKLTAADMPKGTSEAAVDAAVKAGKAPSVLG